MRFSDAHTNSSVCTPTRYGILTGRYSWRTRLKGGVLDGAAGPLIASDRTTVATFLKKAKIQYGLCWKMAFGNELANQGWGKASTLPVATTLILHNL